ncbi:hypothetical protein MMC13_005219 [Lambiella insularis]|nr:hypothetical protein [Lambiella insularis]
MAKAAKRKTDNDFSLSTSAKEPKPRKAKIQFIAPSDLDSADSEEDVAHIQSQQFLLQAKQALKQKTVRQNDGYAQNFKAMVEEKKQALFEQLEKRASQYLAQSTKGQETLKNILSENLAFNVSIPLPVISDTKSITQTKTTLHLLQAKGSSLVALSKELLDAYDEVSQELASHELSLRHVGQDWEGDYRKLQHLLEVGQSTTKDRARALAVGDSKEVGDCNQEEEFKDRQTWVELAGISKDGGGGDDSWAATAHKIERGMMRLAKCLPEDDEC